jgi:hypothetical protein
MKNRTCEKDFMKTTFVLLLCMSFLITGCTPSTAVLPSPAAVLPDPAPALELSSLQYPETGPIIRLSYDPALTGPVEAGLVPAVANSPDLLFSLVHPAFIQLRFPEYAKNRTFQLPFPMDVPQMMFYRTRDFAGYESDSSLGYSGQLSRLKILLEKGIHPEACAQPLTGAESALPFLPLVNAAQVFCAKAQPVAFADGKGIRYVTYYAQGMDPAMEWFVFYTFQGLSDDGQYYVSAVLPIQTNILPDEPPEMGAELDVNALAIHLQAQVKKINTQADDRFNPSISMLDGLISGVHIPGD